MLHTDVESSCFTTEARCEETAKLIHVRQTPLLLASQHVESLQDQHRTGDCKTLGFLHSASRHTNSSSARNACEHFSLQEQQPYTRGQPVTAMPYTCGSTRRSYAAFRSFRFPDFKAKVTNSIIHSLPETEEHRLRQDIITHDLTTQGPVTHISRSELYTKCAGYNDLSNDDKSSNSTASSFLKSVRRSMRKVVRRNRTSQLRDDIPEQDIAKQRADSAMLNQEKLLRAAVGESNDFTLGASRRIRKESVPSEPSVRPLPSHSRYEQGDASDHENGHLLRTTSCSDLPEFNNSELSKEKEIKSMKRMMLIMMEMIQTERDYVKSLEYIIENFLPELLREDIPQPLRGQRNVIFGNIEQIYEFHSQYFQGELEECENSPLHVGKCFLKYEQQFYLYALYNKNKPKSDALMSEYGTPFFRKKQLELGDKLDLASYLFKPVQRMGKYALLLKELLKVCPEAHSKHQDLRDAEEMIRFQLRHVNDLLAMDTLRNCNVNLKEQGQLLRQDEFLVWESRFKKSLRQVFLFEYLILFSKPHRDPDHKENDVCHFKYSIKTSDIGLTEQVGDSPIKFEIWFRKGKGRESLVLQAPNLETKNAWVQEISELLWKQAFRNRETSLAETPLMGKMNQLLAIKPSEHQIRDRCVDTHQSCHRLSSTKAKEPKLRYSTVSVSSSSSDSSQTSHYGSWNFGFDDTINVRLLHLYLPRQDSSESGFCTDSSESGDGSTESEKQKHQDVNKKADRRVTLPSNDSNQSANRYLETSL